MPVVTTVNTVGPTTTTTYTINIVIEKVKAVKKINPAFYWDKNIDPANVAPTYGISQNIRYKAHNLVPNTPLTTSIITSKMSGADSYMSTLSLNQPKIVNAPGTTLPNVLFKRVYENYFVGGASNVYEIYMPAAASLPFNACIEADLGYPFGTIRIITEPGGYRVVSSATPPGGWVRNTHRRGKSGLYGVDTMQVSGLGSRCFFAQWLGVHTNDGSTWGRNLGFSSLTVPPTWKANIGLLDNTNLINYNYQTSTIVNIITVTGRWRSVIHDDHSTYFPKVGPYIGSSFGIAFTSSGSPKPSTVIAFGTSLSTPALPADKYYGLYLEVTQTSDWVTAGGSPQTSTQTYTYPVINAASTFNPPQIEYGIGLAPYWPWDVPKRQYGIDDATVRWVNHLGYRPDVSQVPSSLPETNVAPVLTRIGKVIYLQGGTEAYTGAPRYPTAATPPATGFVYTTDPTLSNGSAMTAKMVMRAVSMEYSVEWSSSTIDLVEQFESTTPTSYTPTTVVRQIYLQQYLDGATRLDGPGLLTADICALVNNTNGAAGNVPITSTQYSYPSVVGMSGGSASSPAKGRLWLTSAIDGYKLTIGDGILTKIFEFDSNSSVVAGNVLVTIVSGNMNATIANLATAVNSSGLSITASVPTLTDLKVEITLARRVGQSGGWRQSINRWTVAAP